MFLIFETLCCHHAGRTSVFLCHAKDPTDKRYREAIAAAGFKMKLADTPAKMAHLETLSQNKIMAHEKDGSVYYIYADVSNCQCFYWGREKAYQSFLQLQAQQNIANEERMEAEMNEQEYLWTGTRWDMTWQEMVWGLIE